MQRLAQLGIRGTVLALAAASVAIGLVVAGLVVVQVAQLDALEAREGRLGRARPHLHLIGRLVVDLETGTRGFVLTGDPAFLEPYTAAVRQLPRVIGETRAELADEPTGLAHLARVETLIRKWIEEVGEPIVARRRRASGPATEAVLADMVQARAGKATMDEVRAALAEMDRSQHLALVALNRDVDKRIDRLLVTIPVATIFGCVIVLLMGAITGGHLRARIEAVAEQGERVAEGELEAPDGLADRTETGRLARAFAMLGLTLRAQTAETNASQRRVALLAQATQRLGASLDVEPTLNAVAHLAVPTLADWCIVDLLEDDGSIRRVAVAHADPSKAALAAEVLEYPPAPSSPHPAAVSMRTRQSQIGSIRFGSATDTFFDTEGHLDVIRRVGPRAYLVVPLMARGRTVGALSFLYSDSGRCYEPSDLGLAEELARRAAVAIDNAHLYAASQRAEARAAFLAEATGRVSASLDLDATLDSIVSLAVPDLADICVIDILSLDGQPGRSTVAHADPAKEALLREMRRRFPVEPTGRCTAAQAMATRQPQLRAEIDEAFLGSAACNAEHLEMLRASGWRSGVSAPLEARGRVIGALTLIATRPERRFGRADVALTEQIARKAALAVDNALLYREARLARSETRQQVEFTSAITDSLGEGVLALDLEGRINFANRAATEMLGWGADDLRGQRADATFHPGHEAAQGRCVLLEGLEAGRITRHDDDTFVVRSGQPLPVSVTASPILAQGILTGAVVVFRDVSQRRAIEARLREIHKMEAVGQLAGGIAHDFNNILTAILGYSDLLARSAGADERLASGLDEIRKAAERAAGLTRQLLAFGRKQRLAPTVLDLDEALARLVPTLGRVVGERVKVEVRRGQGVGRVKVDPTLLDEALTRLAMNARDAMSNGGRLVVTTENAVIDSAYAAKRVDARPGAYVRITVQDTGSGMDATTLAHAFEPFYTTKEVGQGSGLGLAMVHGFVTQSGGHVAAESAPGEGTIFRIYLPRVEEPARTPAGRPAAPKTPAPRTTVLLVDDEDALRQVARIVLEDHGYQVLEAADAEQAVAVAAAHREPIALLLTDVVMPGMNGRQLADRLTAVRPGLGVLYMSGYSDDMLDQAGGLGAGAPFLEKPFSPEVLLRKVAATLEAPAPASIRS